jgi:hypothetical protein
MFLPELPKVPTSFGTNTLTFHTFALTDVSTMGGTGARLRMPNLFSWHLNMV